MKPSFGLLLMLASATSLLSVTARAETCPPGQVLGRPGLCVWQCLCPDGTPSRDCKTCGGSASPERETDCWNRIDDDRDGKADCADDDCAGSCTERDCANGLDDDRDGLVDCADSDCRGSTGACVERNCRDGIDEDGDGLIDCGDPDCAALPECRPVEPCQPSFAKFSKPKERDVFLSGGKVADLYKKYTAAADSAGISLSPLKLKLTFVDASGNLKIVDGRSGDLEVHWTEQFSRSYDEIWFERLGDAVAVPRPDLVEEKRATMDVICGELLAPPARSP